MTTLSDDILTQLEGQGIELPSWAFGNSGTRFRVWTTEGTPRDPREKIADAAQVNKHSALAPSVALHIPWDTVDAPHSIWIDVLDEIDLLPVNSLPVIPDGSATATSQ